MKQQRHQCPERSLCHEAQYQCIQQHQYVARIWNKADDKDQGQKGHVWTGYVT